ncbi:MAG TPA: hypothetical protein VIS06_19615 [Mycobacteriales bacterium]
MSEFPDWRPSPNIRDSPDIYQLENRAFDPDGLVLAEMRRLAPWAGRYLVDLGCGTGFWLPGYATEAASVTGVEPDPTPRFGTRPSPGRSPGSGVPQSGGMVLCCPLRGELRSTPHPPQRPT